MSPLAACDRGLVLRARADQVATLYRHGHLTTLSMGLGAAIFCAVLWDVAPHAGLAAWALLVALNQAWRTALLHVWRRVRPGAAAAPRWGAYWALGSTIAGSLWGAAAVAFFPPSPVHEVLLIVCLFGVVMGGLNLTAIYKPSFYGFVLPALVPLIVRVAMTGDAVHGFIAGVMGVVLAFVVGFGGRLNDVLTHSLTIRYENLDLIDELKRRTRAALEAGAAAKAADRAKSQLLAAASHDLRQPLHALGLYAAALASRARSTDCEPLVDNVQAGIAALDRQFAQLLDLSRLEAGVLHPQLEDVPLGPLLERVTAEFAGSALSRNLVLRVARTTAVVRSDAALLERIVGNLVANAVRYTRRGGVVVGVLRRGRDVGIAVVDTGIGIPPSEAARIFEEFYQVPDAHVPAGRKGMGLGLAIVRRFADLLEHRIELRSQPGAGSRFLVRIPRAPTSRRLRPSGPARPLAHRPSVTLDGMLVAVLDDDPTVLDAMRALFSTWNADVAVATSVERLLDEIGRAGRYPDLIVADLRIATGVDGVDAIEQLRDELGRDVPALVVTGDMSDAAATRVREAALPLLYKPLDPGTLGEAATQLMATSEAPLVV